MPSRGTTAGRCKVGREPERDSQPLLAVQSTGLLGALGFHRCGLWHHLTVPEFLLSHTLPFLCREVLGRCNTHVPRTTCWVWGHLSWSPLGVLPRLWPVLHPAPCIGGHEGMGRVCAGLRAELVTSKLPWPRRQEVVVAHITWPLRAQDRPPPSSRLWGGWTSLPCLLILGTLTCGWH